VTVTRAVLGGVPTAEITVDGVEPRHPAAVDDALAAYQALLEGGTAPSDIALVGESAGGGLAVATLVNARDHGLALAASALVMSPYVDLTLAGATDDAVRLARQAATADVAVTLDITPRVPHVFQAYHAILDEAAAALDRAGQLLSAHLAGAARVTA
jgi:epsilon-lactone hydrolase